MRDIVVTHPDFRPGPLDRGAGGAGRARRAARALLHHPLHRQVHVGAPSTRASAPSAPERNLLSTDLGQPANPPVEDGLAADRRPPARGRVLRRGDPDDGRPTVREAGRMSRRVLAIGAHAADFVWRAGGALAVATARRRHRAGDRALLRRARRVRRAVEGGGPDDRERQAGAPRRGREGRRGARRRLPRARLRRLPARGRARALARGRRRDPRVRARRDRHPHRQRPVQPRPSGRLRGRRARPRARRGRRGGERVRLDPARRSCSCSSPTSPSCATSPRRRSWTSPR